MHQPGHTEQAPRDAARCQGLPGDVVALGDVGAAGCESAPSRALPPGRCPVGGEHCETPRGQCQGQAPSAGWGALDSPGKRVQGLFPGPGSALAHKPQVILGPGAGGINELRGDKHLALPTPPRARAREFGGVVFVPRLFRSRDAQSRACRVNTSHASSWPPAHALPGPEPPPAPAPATTAPIVCQAPCASAQLPPGPRVQRRATSGLCIPLRAAGWCFAACFFFFLNRKRGKQGVQLPAFRPAALQRAGRKIFF